jgi:soluble lytic murein transglycosylase
MQLLGDTTEYSIDTSTDTSATLAWLDSISPSNAKKTLSSSDSITLYRGLVLLMVGKIKESDFFLEQLEQSFPGNLELQFKLALSYQNYDATMQAFRVARRLTWRIPQNNRSNLPFLVYKLFYPSFYSEAIQRESAIRNIDPFLVSSVIRQESIFNPTIVSPAGAIGLMQIMPYTGKDVARKLGESFTVDSLYLPLTNIRYGARYLRQLLDEFNDNLVLVIAGYNGGPINASRWFDHNKNEDFDLFIEDIEFTETRTYVKKVLSNYWTYRLLSKYPQYAYGAESFEKKDRKYLANQTDE